ncbi:hypothetical protein FKM82_026808, partial [Ascaphus truei]
LGELKEYFSQFGTIKKCLLPFDKETGFHRGFCWVAFSSEEGLLNALQKDMHLLEGAKVKAAWDTLEERPWAQNSVFHQLVSATLGCSKGAYKFKVCE